MKIQIRSEYFTSLLPFLLLLFALASVFLHGKFRNQFYRPGHHDYLSSHGLTLAANISSKHNFLMFERQYLNHENSPVYQPYNRFPIGSFALIKLVIQNFQDDLKTQIYAARILMLLFFIITAILAYFIFSQIFLDHWIALATTLWSFSSYFCLYYNDMIFNDGPGLFGFMLTFHGMVIFALKGYFRQLVIKSCLSLLLTWHIYSILLPFLFFYFISDLWGNRSQNKNSNHRFINKLIFNRHLALGLLTLLFGLLLLFFNLNNEYLALNEKQWTQLPTIQSMFKRLGFNPDFNTLHSHSINYIPFLKEQFHRIGKMSIPFFFWELLQPYNFWMTNLILIVCFIGLIFSHHKILLASLILSGFLWSLFMKNFTAFHDFQALFYIGIPLVFISFILLLIRSFLSVLGNYFIMGFAVYAFSIFILSNIQIVQKDYTKTTEFYREIIDDFSVIRKITLGKNVFIETSDDQITFAGARYASFFYLSGSVINIGKKQDLKNYNFIIKKKHIIGPNLLTPNNHHIFLYQNRK